MSRTTIDVTKKAGYAPYAPPREWQTELVGIRVPAFDNDGEGPSISVGIQGVHYVVPRGENVRVPRLIAETLRTRLQDQWAMPGANALQGMVYLGRHSRFYVIDLPAGQQARTLRPQAPLGANERAALENQALTAAQEDALARNVSRQPASAQDAD